MPFFPKDGDPDNSEEAQQAQDSTNSPVTPSTAYPLPTPAPIGFYDANGQKREPMKLSLASTKPKETLLAPTRSSSLSNFSSGPTPLNSSILSTNTSSAAPSNIFKVDPPPFPGLTNAGHTCYVNSCVQALLFTPGFRETLTSASQELLRLNYASAQPKNGPYQNYANFLIEFSSLLEAMMQRHIEARATNLLHPLASLRPAHYLAALSNLDEKYGAASEQQDVQEFFVFLLTSLEEAVTLSKKLIESGELRPQDGLDQDTFEEIFGGIPLSEGKQTKDDTEKETIDMSIHGKTSESKKRPRESDDSNGQHINKIPRDILGEYPVSHSPPLEEGPLAKKSSTLAVDLGTNSDDHIAIAPDHESELRMSIIPASQELREELTLQYNMELVEPPFTPPPSTEDTTRVPLEIHTRETSPSNAVPESQLPAIASFQAQLLFEGQMSSTFKCCECERESGRPENFFDISLAIEKGQDLLWSLNKHFAKGLLNGRDKYSCDQCRTLTEAFNFLRFSKLPTILTIHLKRFAWSEANEAASTGYGLRSSWATGGSKLNFHITCPEELDIPREWISKDLQKELLSQELALQDRGSPLKLSRSSLLPSATPLAKYELYAVIYHSGSSTTFGHYTVAARTSPPRPPKVLPQHTPTASKPELMPQLTPDTSDMPQWAYFDDSKVSVVTHENVMGSISANAANARTAYILLYRRIM